MMELSNPTPTRGQWWRDTINTDLLYIAAIEDNDNVRCLSFTGGIAYLGVMDLSLMQFASGRFEKLPEWEALWYRWKFRKLGAWKS